MLTVAICDDDGVIAEELKGMLEECCREIHTEVLIRIFGRGIDLENTIREGQSYDLIYLDIQMDEQNGIETAKRIRDMNPDVFIIFISGYDQFMEEIFDVNAFNFIHKPIKKERLKKVLQQVLEKIEKRTQFYYLTYNRMTRKIPYQEIVFWESVKRQIVLHLKSGEKISYYEKMNHIEDEVCSKKMSFCRIHQSFLVNMDCITSRCGNELEVTTGDVLTVSRERSRDFILQYSRYLRGESDE